MRKRIEWEKKYELQTKIFNHKDRVYYFDNIMPSLQSHQS